MGDDGIVKGLILSEILQVATPWVHYAKVDISKFWYQNIVGNPKLNCFFALWRNLMKYSHIACARAYICFICILKLHFDKIWELKILSPFEIFAYILSDASYRDYWSVVRCCVAIAGIIYLGRQSHSAIDSTTILSINYFADMNNFFTGRLFIVNTALVSWCAFIPDVPNVLTVFLRSNLNVDWKCEVCQQAYQICVCFN